jgi:predicted MFS family arabinose efflux permease
LYIADKFNWHFTFYMIVFITVIAGIMVVFKMKPITAHLELQTKKNALLHLWHTVKKRDYRVGFLATALLSMGGFMLMPFTSAFLVNNVNILQSQLPLIFLFTGISSIIIMPLIGRLSDKIDKFFLFTIGTAIAIVMVIVYTNLIPVPLWLVVVINMVLFMGIMSRMVPATALNSAVPDMTDRGAYMSVNASLQQMAGGLAALFAGLVVVQKTKTSPIEHFDWLGYVMVLLMLLCLFFVYRVNAMVKSKFESNKA